MTRTLIPPGSGSVESNAYYGLEEGSRSTHLNQRITAEADKRVSVSNAAESNGRNKKLRLESSKAVKGHNSIGDKMKYHQQRLQNLVD